MLTLYFLEKYVKYLKILYLPLEIYLASKYKKIAF